MANITRVVSDDQANGITFDTSNLKRVTLDLDGAYLFIGLDILESSGDMYQYNLDHLSRFPENVKQLLENPNITKVGTYMDHILEKLKMMYHVNITTESTFDIIKNPLMTRGSQKLKLYRL